MADTAMEVDHPSTIPLPTTEAEVISAFGHLSGAERSTLASTLGRTYRNDAKLPSVIRLLLGHNATADDTLAADDPARYLKREVALDMAIAAHNQIQVLFEELFYPAADKRRVVSFIASTASDELILDAYPRCVPAVQQLLEKYLELSGKRMNLLRQIRNETTEVSDMELDEVPLCDKLEEALRTSDPLEWGSVWFRFSGKFENVKGGFANQRQLHKSSYTSKGSLFDHLFALQETYPPPQQDPYFSNTKTRSYLPNTKTIAPIIDSHSKLFLIHNPERFLKIVSDTAWHSYPTTDHRGVKSTRYVLGSVWLLSNRKSRKFIREKKERQEVVSRMGLSLLDVENGALLKQGLFSRGDWTLWQECRALDVVCQEFLEVLFEYTITILTEALQEQAIYRALNHLPTGKLSDATLTEFRNVLHFAFLQIQNIANRLVSASGREDKTEATPDLHAIAARTLAQIIKTALPVLHTIAKTDSDYYHNVQNEIMSRAPTSAMTSFPPLAETQLSEIEGIFLTGVAGAKPNAFLTQMGTQLLLLLRPKSGVITGFSSVPPHSNERCFEVLMKCIPPVVDLEKAEALRFWNSVAGYLTGEQKRRVWERLVPVLSFEVWKGREYDVLTALDAFAPPTERERVSFEWFFHEDATAATRLSLAPYLDVEKPEVKTEFFKWLQQPVFSDRLDWWRVYLDGARRKGTVSAWVQVIGAVVSRTRNEILPNLTQLANYFTPTGKTGTVPRQYLDAATDRQAEKLSELYLKWLDQSHSAVTVVQPVIDFVTKLASEAIARFIDRPEHPLFKFGVEAHWKICVQAYGLAEALDNFSIPLANPVYIAAERTDEELNWEWKLLKTAKERAKATFGSTDYVRGYAITSDGTVTFDAYADMLWGLRKVKEGQEEAFVQSILGIWRSKSDDPEAFGKSVTYRSVVWDLATALGGRWPESPMLLTFVKKLVEELHQRKQVDVGNGEVAIDWNSFERLAAEDCVEHFAGVWDKVCILDRHWYSMFNDSYPFITSQQNWLQADPSRFPWYHSFRTLRGRSTHATTEVELVNRYKEKGVPSYDEFIQGLLATSLSAIHLSFVSEHLCNHRQDLLTDELLVPDVGFPGIYNPKLEPTDANPPAEFKVSNWKKMTPHQLEIFGAKYLKVINDTQLTDTERVEMCETFMTLPTITLKKLETLLNSEDVPQRVKEAILMYIPNLPEPGAAIRVLLSPEYLHTDLARTAIFAAKNCLKHLHASTGATHIAGLFPPPPMKMYKITVQKEAIRLAVEYINETACREVIRRLGVWDELQNDVRVALLQGAVRIVAAVKGVKAEVVGMMWEVLERAAKKEQFRRDGTAGAVLGVSPVHERTRVYSDVPRKSWIAVTSVDAVAIVSVPISVQEEYLRRVLIPMCSKVDMGLKDPDREVVINLRQTAYQAIIPAWVNRDNAAGLARMWRETIESELQVPESEEEVRLWNVLVTGIAECVAHSPKGAWEEFVEVVRKLAGLVTEESTPAIRRRVIERIMGLGLQQAYLFTTVQDWDAPKDRLEIVRPLMVGGRDVIFWKVDLERRIALSKPGYRELGDAVIAEALDLLRYIVAMTNEHGVDDAEYVAAQIINIVYAMPNDATKIAVFDQVVAPDGVVAESLQKDHIQLKAISRWPSDRVNYSEAFVERVVKDEFFYLAKWKDIAGIVKKISSGDGTSTLQRNYVPPYYGSYDYGGARSTGSSVATISAEGVDLRQIRKHPDLISSFFKRASEAGWRGPDAAVSWDALTSIPVACFVFAPQYVGPLLHHAVATASDSFANSKATSSNIVTTLKNLLTFVDCVGLATRKGWHGRTPLLQPTNTWAACIVLDAIADGRLNEIDLTPFFDEHEVAVDIIGGVLFPFFAGVGADGGDADGRVGKSSVESLEKRWTDLLEGHSGYFERLDKATRVGAVVEGTPTLTAAYLDIAHQLISARPRYIVMHLEAYGRHLRQMITSPCPPANLESLANQIVTAFTPSGYAATATGPAWGWCPPLVLALDFVNNIHHDVRAEVDLEGEREGKLAETLAALVLKGWTGTVLGGEAGKWLCAAEGLPAVKTKFEAVLRSIRRGAGRGIAMEIEWPESL
ncbi:hypothetical protein HK097_005305 [Rhizophlyctis rosea]|uniref:Uncharacterized protein n=1 Tax=Rhizophlyctis rosea TaxID=64517 RepID=A0AAD5X5K4_9FUNG|nr:hypothetical protein HK097_005305 [Rhizophlyctis rosea]